MSKLRVAVLGAGIPGSRRVRVFHEQEDADVVALVDPDRQRAQAVAECIIRSLREGGPVRL